MSLTASFTASQDSGNKSYMVLTDTSSGSDGTITSRRVTIKKHDNSTLVQSGTSTTYEVWSYASSTVSLNLIDRDYALSITVDWMNGASVVTSVSALYLFKDYGEEYLYSLTQYQAANPKLISNSNYFSSKSKLRLLLDDAVQAIQRASDQTIAQYCLNAAKQIIDNQVNFF